MEMTAAALAAELCGASQADDALLARAVRSGGGRRGRAGCTAV